MWIIIKDINQFIGNCHIPLDPWAVLPIRGFKEESDKEKGTNNVIAVICVSERLIDLRNWMHTAALVLDKRISSRVTIVH